MTIPDENALRSWHFRELKWSLQALAIAASDQLKLFPEFVVKADEMALAFDHWASLVRSSYESELSRSQSDSLAAIAQKLATMSRDGAEFDLELWTDSAPSSSAHWDDVRMLATSALEAFDWPAESPPSQSKGPRGDMGSVN